MNSMLFNTLFIVVILFCKVKSQQSNTTSTATETLNSTNLNFNSYLDFCDKSCAGQNQVCVDQKCECKPNYSWNDSKQICDKFVCNSSKECQTYDSNRFCDFESGICFCNQNTEENSKNGNKCVNKVCSGMFQCPSSNCMHGICICKTGTKMNYDLGQCEQFNCSTSKECQVNDQNMFCDKREGRCKCKETFQLDIYDINKCEPKYCYGFNSSCFGENQFCFGSYCYCDQNYRLSDETGKCELYSCVNSSKCQINDPNSFCSKGLCKCKTNFIKPKINSICLPDICSTDLNCADPHAFCVDGVCQCEPNYHLSNISGNCQLFRCQHSYQCQSYDIHRHCINGICSCINKTFSPDPNNGFKCKAHSCGNSTDCKADNLVCVDHKCKCAPNYYYNISAEICEYFVCNDSNSCFAFPNTQCISGKCLCADGYKSDDTNGAKCVKSSTTYHKSCLSNSDCDSGQGCETCVDNRCKCTPNYKYNSKLLKCQTFVCKNTTECTAYDSSRVCNNGYCVCKDNYISNDQNGGICRKKSATYEKWCSKNDDCSEVNQRCVDSLCRCKPNYKWNKNLQICEYFSCNSRFNDYCSQSYDIRRQCDPYGSGCVCTALYYPDKVNGDKCTFTPITFTPIINDNTTTYSYDYTWVYIFVPVVFIVSCVSSLFRLHKAVHKPTRPQTKSQTNC